MDNFNELLRSHGLELLTALFEFFKRLDHRLGHAPVGFFGATDDGEFFRSREAFVTVGVVETEAH